MNRRHHLRPSDDPVFEAPPREREGDRPPNQVTLTLDGASVTVDEGMTVLEACRSLGVEIPHFCYHPGLSIAGNCRMCLVEVEGPRGSALAISCATRVAQGQVIRTGSPMVQEARSGVLEFLLLNHPLDCPICDQAGECGLQIYYMQHDRKMSRLETEKVHKDKVVKVGPRVMLDQERCILCTRCTRFCDEITHTSELCLEERGNHARITTFPGKGLDNPYSVCVTDVCPVGALTSREFRFQERVWFMRGTDSICTGCARGCNVSLQYHHNVTNDQLNGVVFRLLPRYNPRVNDYWMCDAGRLTYKRCNERRVRTPLVRSGEGRSAALVPVAWDDALARAASLLESALKTHGPGAVAFWGSPQCATEELHLLSKLWTDVASTGLFSARSPKPPGDFDDYLILADKHPNSAGVELVGGGESPAAMIEAIAADRVRALVLLDADPIGEAPESGKRAAAEAFERLETLVAIGPNHSASTERAAVMLPTASVAEKDGTFINAERRVQRFYRAYPPRFGARDPLGVINDLARRLGAPDDGPGDAAAVFREMTEAYPELAGMTFDGLAPFGAPLVEPGLATSGDLEDAEETCEAGSIANARGSG